MSQLPALPPPLLPFFEFEGFDTPLSHLVTQPYTFEMDGRQIDRVSYQIFNEANEIVFELGWLRAHSAVNQPFFCEYTYRVPGSGWRKQVVLLASQQVVMLPFGYRLDLGSWEVH